MFVHVAFNKAYQKCVIGMFAADNFNIEEAKDMAMAFELVEGLSIEKKEASAAPQSTCEDASFRVQLRRESGRTSWGYVQQFCRYFGKASKSTLAVAA